MNETLSYVHTAFLYIANGGLAVIYTIWAHLAGVLTAGAMTGLVWQAPVSQRPWVAAIAGLATCAALFAPAPVPFLLTGMAAAGLLAVRLDAYNPAALTWRVSGGLALYAVAALCYLAYSRYLVGVDAGAWAQAVGGQDEAQTALAQGQAFLETLATWGLWLILPLGYLSLLGQGLLIHPPLGQGPAETIAAVRTRGR